MVLAPPPVGGVGEEGYCGLTPGGSHEARTGGGPEYREARTWRGRAGTRGTAGAGTKTSGRRYRSTVARTH
ncbi:hypothetical protein C4J65_16960 [Streptomyces sp. CB09001]|nr:hypothetical protein C4J65_16960 [Streptomyces sp. CB09001]